MKTSNSKSEVLHLSRNLAQCSLQDGGVSLKQVQKLKYLGVALMTVSVMKGRRIGCLTRDCKSCNASSVPFNRVKMEAIERQIFRCLSQ